MCMVRDNIKNKHLVKMLVHYKAVYVRISNLICRLSFENFYRYLENKYIFLQSVLSA